MIKVIFLALFIFSFLSAYAEVEVNCTGSTISCAKVISKINKDIQKTEDLELIREHLKLYMLEGKINYVEILKDDSKYIVNLFLEKDIVAVNIRNISNRSDEINIKDDIDDILEMYIDKKFNSRIKRNIKLKVVSYLNNLGFKNSSVNFLTTMDEISVRIHLDIDLGSLDKGREINIFTDDKRIKDIILFNFRKKYFTNIDLKSFLDELKDEYIRKGFLFFKYKIKNKNELKNKDVEVEIDKGPLVLYKIESAVLIKHDFLVSELNKRIENFGLDFSKKEIESWVGSILENLGVFYSNYHIRESLNKVRLNDDRLEERRVYYISILKGKKVKLREPVFIGNKRMSSDHLRKTLIENGDALTKYGFLSESFLKGEAVNLLKEEYLRNGFIFVDIKDPVIERGKRKATVFYNIKEGNQCLVNKLFINHKNIPENLKLKNQEKKPFNPLQLDNDLKTIENYYKERGYIRAKLNWVDKDESVQYRDKYKKVDINVTVDLGPKFLFGGHHIIGLNKTKRIVIDREIFFKENEFISFSELDALKKRLESLSLFSSVKIITKDVSDSSIKEFKAKIIIKVKERDFGVVEVAPGFRTDIGLKTSLLVEYNNLFGLNRSLSTFNQVNQRLDYEQFDDRRKKEERKLLEFKSNLKFEEPYIFGLPLRFESQIDYSRRRYFSFDADIFEGKAFLTKDLSSYLSLSLGYNLQFINQFDASEKKDDKFLRIGSVLPSIALDLRDNAINPRSGGFFSLSYEYSSPKVFSMDKENLKIEFYSITQRNKLYFPISEDVTLATSISWGMQQNLAKEDLGNSSSTDEQQLYRGYIPSIKVFRLSGEDRIRGFSDPESNRLINGNDISDELVQNSALFFNFKLEPRFKISDTFMIAPFYDAGRIFLNNFLLSKIRQSIGLSFKLLTPVGSLNFDAGVKINRRSYNGNEEDFWRFHVTIGSF